MSNAVDILFFGGPHHGMIHCAQRPLTGTYTVPAADGEFVYEHRQHIRMMQRYHIAVLAGVDPSQEDVDELIDARGFNPAWDLHVRVEQTPDGGRCMTSAWIPTPDEVERIRAGRVFQALAQQPSADLCIDEGCPHHGTPHVCVNDLPPAEALAATLAAQQGGAS